MLFLPGAFTMACVAIALFFTLYWRKTKDRLFAVLALAFLLFAIERVVLAFVPADQEGRHWIFLARLIGFVLIIIGIVDKNRPQRREKRGPRAEGSADRPRKIEGDQAATS